MQLLAFPPLLLSNPAPTQGPLESRHDRQRPRRKDRVSFSREHFERLSRWFAFRVLSYLQLVASGRSRTRVLQEASFA